MFSSIPKWRFLGEVISDWIRRRKNNKNFLTSQNIFHWKCLTLLQDSLSWCKIQWFYNGRLTCITLFLSFFNENIGFTIWLLDTNWLSKEQISRYAFDLRLANFYFYWPWGDSSVQSTLFLINMSWTTENTFSVDLSTFCKRFRCIVSKSLAKSDNTPLFQIYVTHFQNALEKIIMGDEFIYRSFKFYISSITRSKATLSDSLFNL